MRKLVFVSVVSLLALSTAPAAAEGVEVTLAAGFSIGETDFDIEASGPLILCVTTPCILAEARTDEGGPTPTLIVDLPVARGWWLEGLYLQADGDLELVSTFPPGSLDPESFDSATLLLGVQRRWQAGRWRPFVLGAAGATSFETGALVYERTSVGAVATPVDEEVFAASLASGALLDLGSRLALRLEGRVLWHDLPQRLGGSWEQIGASVGLTYRF